MGIFSPDVWTHCNYIAETFGDMFLTHCDTSVPTFTILVTVGWGIACPSQTPKIEIRPFLNVFTLLERSREVQLDGCY